MTRPEPTDPLSVAQRDHREAALALAAETFALCAVDCNRIPRELWDLVSSYGRTRANVAIVEAQVLRDTLQRNSSVPA